MYLKILRFRGDRAICATDIGKDLDVRRTLLPVTASVGDAFKLGLNETYDGLTYEPITEDNTAGTRNSLKRGARERGLLYEECSIR